MQSGSTGDVLCDGCKKSGKLKAVGYSDHGAGEPVMLCKDCRRPDNVVFIRSRLGVAPRDDRKKAAQAKAKAAGEAKTQKEQERAEERAENERQKKQRGKAKTRPEVRQTGKTARNRAKKAKKMALEKD